MLIRASKRAADARRTIVPDWVTDSGYTEDLDVRTKVGDDQNQGRAGIIATGTGEVTWLDVKPEDYEGEGRVTVRNAGWNDAGTKAFVFAVSFRRQGPLVVVGWTPRPASEGSWTTSTTTPG